MSGTLATNTKGHRNTKNKQSSLLGMVFEAPSSPPSCASHSRWVPVCTVFFLTYFQIVLSIAPALGAVSCCSFA